MGRAAVMAALVLLSTAAFASAADAQTPGTVTGRAVSTGGEALAGALVFVDGGAHPAARTDAAGRYRVSGLTPGRHTVEVRRAGYTAASAVVEVSAVGATADLSLAPAAYALRGVTVIGTRGDLAETRERVARVPGGAALVGSAEIQASRQANLKDVLRLTPGVYIQPRFGAADESQISVRGSGLRNNYHARGINLLVNGMPYRNADGFTDFESLELLTTEAIEVYKGANALRYGGSTLGGAIALDTKTGYTASPVAAFAQGGGYGFHKEQLSSGGVRGAADYYASYAHTGLDGFRQWSDQRRDRVNVHGGYRLSGSTDLRTFYFFAHVKEHLPGSVNRATLEGAPESADAGNVSGRWGRDYTLHHVGVQLRAQLSPTQRVEVSPYLQYRDIDHPIFEVINQQSHDWGAEVRYESTAPVAGMDNRFTLGVQPAYETMHTRQFVNAAGAHGALTRDERDRATTTAVYAENALSLTPRLTATAGARFDRATRRVEDRLLSNGDQSDRRTYRPVTPRVGVLYTAAGGGQVFANASRTVEPPLFLELTSFGNAGGFNGLKAQDAWQYEVGARGRRSALGWELSLYDVELRNEIVNLNVQPFPAAPFTVPTFRNSPRTRHYGAEAGAAYELPGGLFLRGAARDRLTLRAAYTFARYRYVRDAAYAGNDIPGAPSHYLTAEARYEHPAGLSLAPSLEWVPQSFYVDSGNATKNDAWSNLGLRAEWTPRRARATLFVAGQNLADRRYSQSVQVDNAAGKFFEPADRRSFYAGIRWAR
ncbi:MAG: putative TonB-dependent receptor [Gemmatimonadetes bacterium]|nr:putative TonB-dependent receptor [Gemmatimonadota bacterium]